MTTPRKSKVRKKAHVESYWYAIVNLSHDGSNEFLRRCDENLLITGDKYWSPQLYATEEAAEAMSTPLQRVVRVEIKELR